MKLKNWLAAGLVVTATMVGSVAPSFAAGRDLAVLVVGRGNDKDMAATERAVIETLTRLRVQRGWNHKLLPIYSYHFDKPAEKSYCEERLKVKQGDLIVVGLVELESGVPVDFVFRENDVATAEPVADKVMDRARAELAARGRLASTTPPPATTPTHPPTTTKPTPARPTAPSTTVATHSPSTPSTPVATRPSSPSTPSAPVATRPLTPPQTPVTAPASPATAVVKPPTTPIKLTPAPPLKTPAPVVKTPAPVVKHTPAPPVAVNPATTKPAETPVVEGNEKYIVQLGLFSTLDKARTFIAKLKETNPDVQVEIRKGAKDGQVVYRVVLAGLFATSADAAARAKALTEAGVQAFRTKFEATTFGTVVK